MKDLQLRFINYSNNAGDSSVVIFQRKPDSDPDAPVIAWRIINKIGIGAAHPFDYPVRLEIGVQDTATHYRKRFPADKGQEFTIERDSLGEIAFFSSSGQPDVIGIMNKLAQDMIDVTLYINGTAASTLRNIGPYQEGLFAVRPTLFIGVVPDTHGGIIDPTTISSFTELSLANVVIADITMADSPSPSTPYHFTLENVRHG